MYKCKSLSIIVSLILLACLLGSSAQAQMNNSVSATPGGSYPGDASTVGPNLPAGSSASSAVSMYSQYYSMPRGNSPKAHITAPQKYNSQSLESYTIHFNVPKYATTYTQYQAYAVPVNQYQTYAVPYSQYQSTYSTYTGGNSLWIQGSTGLTQFAVVPQGASLTLTAISSAGGNGYLYEIVPGGNCIMNSFNFYPYNSMSYYADTVGQHILLFIIDDKVSNAVVIDVVGNYPPTNQQTSYQQPSYQQPNYQQPNYQQPNYQQPSYQQPGAQQLSYGDSGGY
jgi:hypothetical protein